MPRKKMTPGQALAAKRKTFAGGRPTKATNCKKCGRLCPTARGAREHCKGKARKVAKKVAVTIQQVFDGAKVLGEVQLQSGERILTLELRPSVILLTGFDKAGQPWDSTQHTVDFALNDEAHDEDAQDKMLADLGMKRTRDFWKAYSLGRRELMARFAK